MSMIEKLLEEMFTNCPACQGTGFKFIENEEGIHEPECESCLGSGYDTTWEGEQLIQAITRREKL